MRGDVYWGLLALALAGCEVRPSSGIESGTPVFCPDAMFAAMGAATTDARGEAGPSRFSFSASQPGTHRVWVYGPGATAGLNLSVLEESGEQSEGRSSWPTYGGTFAFVELDAGEVVCVDSYEGATLKVTPIVDDAGETVATAKEGTDPSTYSPYKGVGFAGEVDFFGDVDLFRLNVKGGVAYTLLSFGVGRDTIWQRTGRFTFEDASGAPVSFPLAADQTIFARVTADVLGSYSVAVVEP